MTMYHINKSRNNLHNKFTQFIHALLSLLFCFLIFHDAFFFCPAEDIKGDSELTNLAENFREQAAKLVEMLDISIPVVAKLKVQ